MEDATSLPPLGLAPMDTQGDGAETSSETGQQAASEETVHPNGASNSEGDGSGEGDSANAVEPFHKEGDQVFKTKEEYIAHVNQQRGAASRTAHDKSLAEQRAQHFETLYKTALEAVGKPAAGAAIEPEMTPEAKQAMDTLKKAGFLTTDQAKAMVDEALKPFKAASEVQFREKVEEARVVVDHFIELNPDAADHAAAIEQTLLNMERAGLPGGLDEAYYLVLKKLPKTSSEVVANNRSDERKVRAAQAGGAPSNRGGGTGKEKDIFDGILGSSGPSLVR